MIAVRYEKATMRARKLPVEPKETGIPKECLRNPEENLEESY